MFILAVPLIKQKPPSCQSFALQLEQRGFSADVSPGFYLENTPLIVRTWKVLDGEGEKESAKGVNYPSYAPNASGWYPSAFVFSCRPSSPVSALAGGYCGELPSSPFRHKRHKYHQDFSHPSSFCQSQSKNQLPQFPDPDVPDPSREAIRTSGFHPPLR